MHPGLTLHEDMARGNRYQFTVLEKHFLGILGHNKDGKSMKDTYFLQLNRSGGWGLGSVICYYGKRNRFVH